LYESVLDDYKRELWAVRDNSKNIPVLKEKNQLIFVVHTELIIPYGEGETAGEFEVFSSKIEFDRVK
jgi:hypothetical protein